MCLHVSIHSELKLKQTNQTNCFRFAIPAEAFGAHRFSDRAAHRRRTGILYTSKKIDSLRDTPPAHLREASCMHRSLGRSLGRWVDRSAPPKTEGPKTESLRPTTQDRNPKTENRKPKGGDRRAKTEDLRPNTEDIRPKTEGRRLKTEDSRPKTECLRPKTDDRRRKTEVRRPKKEDRIQKAEDLRPKT